MSMLVVYVTKGRKMVKLRFRRCCSGGLQIGGDRDPGGCTPGRHRQFGRRRDVRVVEGVDFDILKIFLIFFCIANLLG